MQEYRASLYLYVVTVVGKPGLPWGPTDPAVMAAYLGCIVKLGMASKLDILAGQRWLQ